MAKVVGKIVVYLTDDGKADVHIEGMDELQVAQAMTVTASSIIGRFRKSRGAKDSVIITPDLGGFGL